jgi:hypothetical protein
VQGSRSVNLTVGGTLQIHAPYVDHLPEDKKKWKLSYWIQYSDQIYISSQDRMNEQCLVTSKIKVSKEGDASRKETSER